MSQLRTGPWSVRNLIFLFMCCSSYHLQAVKGWRLSCMAGRMDSIIKDIGFALRTLRKNSGFTTIAVIMIALGIGSCAAIFSIVNTVLIQPLPYSDPSRLVLVWTELRARNVLDFPFPIPDVKDLRL